MLILKIMAFYIRSTQHGFRKRRSCETQLINTVHNFASALNNREQIDTILLDMSKAFDTVPHERLCHKLSLYGIRGRSFLSGRTQKVILHGQESRTTKVSSRVPQVSSWTSSIYYTMIQQARSHWLGWSGVNLTTFYKHSNHSLQTFRPQFANIH